MRFLAVAVAALSLLSGGAAADDGPFLEAARTDGAEEAATQLVRVFKGARVLQLLAEEQVLAEYRIALGSQPLGHKQQAGDGRTPEGRYVLDSRRVESEYHLAIHISYPNAADRRRARARGVDPGGAIMVHGLPNGLGLIGHDHVKQDWTDGCIAVTNEEMDEIWQRVEDGTPIEILP